MFIGFIGLVRMFGLIGVRDAALFFLAFATVPISYRNILDSAGLKWFTASIVVVFSAPIPTCKLSAQILLI